MVEVLIVLLLLLAFDVAAILWGADSRGLDPDGHAAPALSGRRSTPL